MKKNLDLINDPVIVIEDDNMHEGVIGILAAESKINLISLQL